MLIADVNFHLNIAYEQYRLYKTPDSVHNMLKMVLFHCFTTYIKTNNLSNILNIN